VAVRRRLDAELVRRGLLDNLADAALAIEAGRVLVAGSPAFSATRLVAPGEALHVVADAPRFVSRGGEKLAAALVGFDVDVRGRRALDAGASTGGFTDCLLQAGATEVVAVDVARGQLAWRLRHDPRVTLLERTNARDLDPASVGGAVDVVAADVSFVSLRTVAPALARCSRPDADFLLLVKPQFEAGRARVGEGGVVRDPDVHRAVLREVRDDLRARGLVAIDAMTSPLRGADGNVEFLFHCRRDGVPVDDAVLDACVDDAMAHPGARR
jgi:23S rRNA (cytidine1920-2'-O)/16S rRNA (cytidine1409-2'-O)-methyltransferase